MEESPSWEGDSHSASQEIRHILWNLKVHYHVSLQRPTTGLYPEPDASTP